MFLVSDPSACTVAPAVRAALVAASRREAPREACGLLFGRQEDGRLHVLEGTVERNLASGDDAFEIDPGGLLRASLGETEDRRWLGVWHSHPSGPATLSAADLRGAWDGHLQLVVGERELRLWRVEGGYARELRIGE